MARLVPRQIAIRPDRRQEELFQRVAEIIEAARGHVVRTVNSAMVHAYWHIGREIVEVEQQGKKRAGYGDRLVRQLAARLTERHGKGFSYPSVKRMKQFFLTFPRGSTIAPDGRHRSKIQGGCRGRFARSGTAACASSWA